MITTFIVDDDAHYADMLKDFLVKYHELSVHIFLSGEDCLKNLELKPDVIFLDYHFDRLGPQAMDGLEILKKIKATNPEIEVVMVSANDKIDVAINCKNYHAYDFIVKSETAFHRAEIALSHLQILLALRSVIKSHKDSTGL